MRVTPRRWVLLLIVIAGCGKSLPADPPTDESVDAGSNTNDALPPDASTTNDDGGGGDADSSSPCAACASGHCAIGGSQERCDPLAFVTAKTFTGKIGKIAGLYILDDECQKAATEAGLPGTYMAWASDSMTNASLRFQTASPRPYRRRDGKIFVENFQQLISTTTRSNALDLTENGIQLGDSERVWTGSGAGGTTTGHNCSNWTAEAPFFGTAGIVSARDSKWTFADPLPSCNALAHLYCFEQIVDPDE